MLMERQRSSRRWLYLGAIAAGVVLLATLALGGCASGNPGPTPTPTKTRLPTFTPVKAPAAAPALADAATPTPAPVATVLPPTPAPTATVGAPAAVPTATLPTAARLTVSSATANLRRGPGTNYDTIGAARQGEAFEVTGKNAGGDWWQINANGDPAWVAASVVSVENPQLVALAQNIPAPPVVAVAPPAPTQAPAPAAPRPAAPPPAADPCANIGGDGCKWRVVAGPLHGENGGQELKMQFLFIHSGLDGGNITGGQPQPSYFVVLIKDGQQLPVPDSERSKPGASGGTLGGYNYEYVIGVDKLPGHTVAGNYTLWVLDGNGERDSHNLNFTISGNQGLLYIKFDQA
jgi:uncharacterized protein YraI